MLGNEEADWLCRAGAAAARDARDRGIAVEFLGNCCFYDDGPCYFRADLFSSQGYFHQKVPQTRACMSLGFVKTLFDFEDKHEAEYH